MLTTDNKKSTLEKRVKKKKIIKFYNFKNELVENQ